MLEHQSVPCGELKQVSVRRHPDNDYMGIWVKAELYNTFSIHEDIWQALQKGELKGFSIKGKPHGAYQKCEGTVCHRVIPQFELVEMSLVGDPANQLSTIEEVKGE